MTEIVCFDYGHGGRDPGAIGVDGLREKDTDIIIGRKAATILRNHGIEVEETRITDKYLSLTERANIANRSGADVFISFHHNSFEDEKANGVETFSHIGSVSGAKIAECIQDALVNAKLFKSNRGTKTANFTVLAKTRMPAALTELGFISNKEDNNVIRNNQDELAEAVAKGVLDYFRIQYKGSSSSNNNVRGRTYMLEGDTGSDVRKLQGDLNKLKYRLSIDGSYGPGTKKAVLDFQKTNKLKEDGSAGTEVFNKIKSLLSVKGEANELYKVQVGAYADKSNADKKLAELKKQGHQTYIKKE